MGQLTDEQRSKAASVFRFLVTRGGTKYAYSAQDLAELSGLEASDVESVLRDLGDSSEGLHIVRRVAPPDGLGQATYEIYHDALARPIIEWRQKEEQRELERAQREAAKEVRKERRRARFFAALAGAFLFAVVLVVYLALRAHDEQKLSQSKGLAAHAEALLGTDPALSVQVALEALHTTYSGEAEAALRDALPSVRVRRVLATGRPIYSLGLSPNGKRIVTVDPRGIATISDSATGPSVMLPTRQVIAASFSPDGTRIVTASSTASLESGTSRLGKRS